MKARHSPILLVRRTSLVLAIFAFVGLFAVQAEPATADNPSQVRVIQASPDIAIVAVFVDGAKLLSSFAFGAVTDYAPVPPGAHKVQIAMIGRSIRAGVVMQNLAVQPGVAYTAAAIGTKSTGLSIKVFIDNNFLAAGQAKTRIYNLAPYAGTVDVSANGHRLVDSLGYQQSSNYVVLPTGSYNFTLSAPSTNTSLPLTQTLASNTVTSIFIVGMVNGSPKIGMVSAQVPGLSGLPQTGGYPNAGTVPGSSQPSMPWFPLIVVVLVLIVIGVGLRFAPMPVKKRTHLLPQKVKIPVTLPLQGQAQVRHFKKSEVLFLTSLALIAVLGGVGIGASLWFYTNQQNALSTGPSSRSSLVQPSPHLTVTSEPTAASRTVPVSPMYPTLARLYSGTMRDIPTGLTTSISLTSIRQQQGNVSGYFRMPENNLFSEIPKSGPFQGTVSTSKEVQFTLLDNAGQVAFSFNGSILADKSIEGTYCSLLAATGKCSDYGLWSVSPAS
jgi:Domain of unknown function (DUF4397)